MKNEGEINDLEITQWVNKYKSFHFELPPSNELDSACYIISTTWINNWEKSRENTYSGTDFTTNIPGKVTNIDIIDKDPSIVVRNNYVLLESAKYREDYLIFPKQIWTYFKKTYGVEYRIKRKVVQILNSSPEIEIRPPRLSVFILKNSDLTSEKPYIFSFSITSLVSDIVNELKGLVAQTRTNKEIPSYRLWKLGRNYSASDLLVLVSKGSTQTVAFPGYRLDTTNHPIYSFDLSQNDILVFECKEGYSRQFILKEKVKAACINCKISVNDGKLCDCHQQYFCCCSCELNFHPVVQALDPEASQDARCPNKDLNFLESNPIKTGLINLGNTCYLNAGLQCLFHVKPLTLKLQQGEHLLCLGPKNPGELVLEYSELLGEIMKTSSAQSPGKLKSTLGMISSQFLSFNQQDCQEMLSFLLDSIHEDLNRVQEKQKVLNVEENRNENEVKELYWNCHLNNNNSFIVELMHGQYKSEIECPGCKEVSTSYDPFLMLSLPVPDFSLKIIYFVLVTIEGSVMGKIPLKKSAKLAETRKEISKILDIDDPDTFILAQMQGEHLLRVLEEGSRIKNNSTILIYYKQPASDDSFPEDLRSVIISFKKRSVNKFITIGKPHLIQIQVYLTMKELYFEVFQYMMQMRKIKVDDLFQEFDKRQPSYLKKSYLDTDEFRLQIDNPFNFPCPQCFESSCRGCPIAYSNDLVAGFFISCKEPFLRVSVVLSNKIKDISCFEDLFFHPSCNLKLNSKPISASLSDCFRLFSDKEQLSTPNSVYCSTCKLKTVSNKRLEIVKLPQILIIHLKRFKQTGKTFKKNNIPIHYPTENLDLGQHSKASGLYNLFAIVHHTGSLNSGHYTATCKGFDHTWRHFDDSSISFPQTLFSPSAYILFYEINK